MHFVPPLGQAPGQQAQHPLGPAGEIVFIADEAQAHYQAVLCSRRSAASHTRFGPHLHQATAHLAVLATGPAAGMLRALTHHHLAGRLPGSPHLLARRPENGEHRHPQSGGHVHGGAVHSSKKARLSD